MLSLTKNKSIVGLDIEVGSVAATELRVNGSVEVVGHGVVPLDPGAVREGEVADPEALAEALKELFSEHKLSRNVRLGIANQRVAVRTLRLPALDDDELETAIRFQAQDHIPMPLEQAVLDWQVVGHVNGESGQRQVDVVAVAARRDMLTAVMDALRKAGLRPAGIDHSAFGMIRALSGAEMTAVGASEYVSAPAGAPAYADTPVQAPADAGAHAAVAVAEAPTTVAAAPPAAAKLYCNLADVTNLAVAHDGACRFTRISAFGIEGIAQKLAERCQLTLEHSRQWLVHVGLADELDRIDGDPETVAAAREALTEGAGKLADELRVSLEFYGAQEEAIPVEGIVACGPGTIIPGLPEHLQSALGRPFEIGRPRGLAGFDDATAARLTLAYGLARES